MIDQIPSTLRLVMNQVHFLCDHFPTPYFLSGPLLQALHERREDHENCLHRQQVTSKCHTIYTSQISSLEMYPNKMRETTNKYNLPVHLSKAKLACQQFTAMFYSNPFTYFPAPNLLTFTSILSNYNYCYVEAVYITIITAVQQGYI